MMSPNAVREPVAAPLVASTIAGVRMTVPSRISNTLPTRRHIPGPVTHGASKR
jgi:hypothetical protein